MEVKHNMTDIRTKMKKLEKEKNEFELKHYLEEVFKLMCECNYRTVNLNMNNGYILVAGIVEDGEKKNDKIEANRH